MLDLNNLPGEAYVVPAPGAHARVAEGDRLVKPAVVLMPNDWSPSTLARYRRAGNGPAFTKVGRNIGYSLASLRAWQRGEALSATEA